MRKKRKKMLWVILLLGIAVLVGWIAWGNRTIGCTELQVRSAHLPEAFSGYTIAQVSDLHNAEFGADNERLLEALRQAAPDLIALTGDLVDSRRTDLDCAIAFVQAAVEIAPVYYVTGNHESRIAAYPELEHAMEQAGVHVLRNETEQIEWDGALLSVSGVDDPTFFTTDEQFVQTLQSLLPTDDTFTLLLSHRPELFGTYVGCGVDLTLSGHAHGGQFRLPGIGGLFAPDQGIFPDYDAGAYSDADSTMVVSRGLGNSLFPFRVNNNPELVLITLMSE